PNLRQLAFRAQRIHGVSAHPKNGATSRTVSRVSRLRSAGRPEARSSNAAKFLVSAASTEKMNSVERDMGEIAVLGLVKSMLQAAGGGVEEVINLRKLRLRQRDAVGGLRFSRRRGFTYAALVQSKSGTLCRTGATALVV